MLGRGLTLGDAVACGVAAIVAVKVNFFIGVAVGVVPAVALVFVRKRKGQRGRRS